MRTVIAFILSITCTLSSFAYGDSTLVKVDTFGFNPGELDMFMHTPKNAREGMPLVVVLHGCHQTAEKVATQSGWNKLADEYGFYVLYPEQNLKNNPTVCFNWFWGMDIEKDSGECRSIKTMVEYMVDNFKVDTSKMHVVGLSAGAAMAVVMMSVYPDLFESGAVFAGGPYKSATDIGQAMLAMKGLVNKKPEEWGDLVREQNPDYDGDYARIVIFHGARDMTVANASDYELIEQWTNLHNTDDEKEYRLRDFTGNKDVNQSVWTDSAGNVVAMRYDIERMGHALPIDPGDCINQGGKTHLFAKDKDFHSTWWAAHFFGLVPQRLGEGVVLDDLMEPKHTLTGMSNQNHTITWMFPDGCNYEISDDQALATVKWEEEKSATVTQTITDANGCVYVLTFLLPAKESD